MSVCAPSALAHILLAWYDRNARTLPWRVRGEEKPDPYRVWLSEVMLQQTTVQAVAPYFLRFLERWPTVGDLAAAPVEEVMHAWAGLGYYARARNLHECAKVVAQSRSGVFPDSEEALLSLPGIGAYTAAAITAIAFGRKATVVDGNVERVMARLFAVTDPLPGSKSTLKQLAATLTPERRPGDYAQAVMDLGATVCTPRSPACAICPWMNACIARRQGIEAGLPAKMEKAERPTRHGIAFWTVRKDGAVLLRRRPPQGLLGGMMEIPSSTWSEDKPNLDGARAEAPLTADWRELPGMVRHTFTHFHLEMRLVAARTGLNPLARGIWCPLDQLGDQALPTLMRKIVRHALAKAY